MIQWSAHESLDWTREPAGGALRVEDRVLSGVLDGAAAAEVEDDSEEEENTDLKGYCDDNNSIKKLNQ